MREVYRRVGRFTVHNRFYDRLAPDEGTNLFHRMVVLDIRRNYMADTAEYVAIHPDFRPREQGETIPEYTAVFDSASVYPEWKEVIQ